MTPHVLLTGASSGIGRALAKKLALAGYRLSLQGRNADKLATTISQIQQLPEAANAALARAASELPDCSSTIVHASAFCFSEPQAISDFVAAAQAKAPIDILINCAGANLSRASTSAPDITALNTMMQLNFFAPVALCAAVLPAMQNRGQGTILNLLSTCCLFANANNSGYTASKLALDGYSKVMRKELQGSGVRVLSLYPGGVNTEFRTTTRPDYLSADEVATAALAMLTAPSHVQWHELVLRPAVETNYA
jgi:short-subunit dehydrogenase